MALKHGLSKHPLYDTWTGMRLRCLKETFWAYKYYGGRGITIYPPWRDDARAFIEYIEAELGPRPEGMTLDRRDNSRNYEPGNLRWATWDEQVANRRPQANSTGFPGVKKRVRNGQTSYSARRVVNGKRLEASRDTPDAALAALEAKIRGHLLPARDLYLAQIRAVSVRE
jgi:hypothetical protein